MIPEELVDFCSRKGNSLLIKGEAGTGKTILSLELLRVFAEKKRGFYLSTRVSPERLFRQFPDLSDVIRPEHVVDTKTRYERKTYPSKLVEIFDLRLRDAPGFIDHLYSLASGTENPFIAVDSWDAIARKLKPDDRIKMEDWFEVLITETAAALVFVSEEPEQRRLDYLADGVVTLSKTRIEDRLVREVELNKLRGVRVGQDKYLFTLENGRFQYFKPWQWQTMPREGRKRPSLQEDKNPETVSTCVQGLDELLGGGWRKGSFNLLEIGEAVGDDYLALIVPAVASFLNMGRAFMDFFSGGETGYVMASALPVRPTKKLKERMLFIHGTKTPLSEEGPCVVNVDTSDPAEAEKKLWKLRAKIGKKSKDGVVLGFVGTDVIEREFGPEAAMGMLSREAELVKSSRSVDLVTLKEGQKLPKDIVHLASTHWKLKRKNGVLLFYGVVPNTGIYVAETSFQKGYPETRITPIV